MSPVGAAGDDDEERAELHPVGGDSLDRRVVFATVHCQSAVPSRQKSGASPSTVTAGAAPEFGHGVVLRISPEPRSTSRVGTVTVRVGDSSPSSLARSISAAVPVTGEELRVWQYGGYLHVFTGDTLARDCRASIALEPVETMTNAFNRPEPAAALALEPGGRREFGFGVEYRSPGI
ncbi:hypothetical protein ACWGLF_15780 [Streptomyces puniciscabiei]